MTTGYQRENRANRRSTYHEQLFLIEDLEMEKLLKDIEKPQPDLKKFPIMQISENLQIDLKEMLSEPLGRYFLNQVLKERRKTYSRNYKQVQTTLSAYGSETEEDELKKNQEAGLILSFAETVFKLMRSRVNGAIMERDTKLLMKEYNLDLETTSSKRSETETKDGEEESVRKSAALAKAAILPTILAKVSEAQKKQQLSRTSATASITSPIQHSSKMLREKLNVISEKTILPEKERGTIIDESSSKLIIPMDFQKSMAFSFFSSGVTGSAIPHSANMGGFISKVNPETGIPLLHHDPDQGDSSFSFQLIEQLVARLEDVFEKFKSNDVLVHRYLQLREFSKKMITEHDLHKFRALGHGTYGEVRGVAHKHIGLLMAQKSISKAKMKQLDEKGIFIAELICLRALTVKPSPFCMYLRAAYETEQWYHLILPIGTGGDLAFLLQSVGTGLEFNVVRFYACEIALGIGHLHRLGFLYRDLKPANILLSTQGHCMLTDFGYATFVGDEGTASDTCGTPGYTSPELLEGKPYSVDADWWSYGCVIYELLNGYGLVPFDTRITKMSTREEGVRKLNDIIFNPEFPNQAKPLIRALLNRQVKERCGCMGADFEEIFQVSSFWNGWEFDYKSFQGTLSDLPSAPHEPEKSINAPKQEICEMNLREYQLTSHKIREIDFTPFINVEEMQKDILKVIEEIPSSIHTGVLSEEDLIETKSDVDIKRANKCVVC